MPNHVLNELVFKGDAADQKRVLDSLCNDKGEVDFAILVQTPANVWLGNVSKKHEKLGQSGLDWSRENWGTKWNAYRQTPPEQTEDRIILRFNTAWSPPYPWLVAVFNTLKVSFDHNWLDEGSQRGRCGRWNYDELKSSGLNDPWNETDADDDENRRLHELMWGVEAAREILAEAAQSGN